MSNNNLPYSITRLISSENSSIGRDNVYKITENISITQFGISLDIIYNNIGDSTDISVSRIVFSDSDIILKVFFKPNDNNSFFASISDNIGYDITNSVEFDTYTT